MHTTTIALGATTTYTYYETSSPPQKLAIVTNANSGQHGTRTSLDGFGRTIRVESGYMTGTTFTTVSQVDTHYAACACSPLGKISAVSEPYAGGTAIFTKYTYDARKDDKRHAAGWLSNGILVRRQRHKRHRSRRQMGAVHYRRIR